jgi:uncharacterized protein YndB with AHSA1/START domain
LTVASRRWLGAIVVVAAALPGVAGAEVMAQAREGFVVSYDMLLEATPERSFEALTHEVGAWWDAGHSYSGAAENLSLDARAGGCFCEQLTNGGSVEHMRVVFASPGKLLRMVGGLGPLQGMGASGAMEFALSPEGDDRARLQFRYTVGGFVPDGLAPLAEPVNGVLGGQLGRLATYLKSGSPDET